MPARTGAQRRPTMCGYCSYEEADGELIEQCPKCKAADALLVRARMPKTGAQRQAALNARKKAKGLKEVRNLWCRPCFEQAVRDYAERLETRQRTTEEFFNLTPKGIKR